MEAKSTGKFTYRQIYEYINDEKYPEIIREMRQTRSLENVPVFQGAGDASPLHWWHVFMPMLGRPSALYLQF